MDAGLKKLGEFGLIQRLQKILGRQAIPKNWQGIGDDASIIPLSGSQYLLLTHDLLLQDVHFLAGKRADWEDVGWKALAVNLSDLAAMGAKPREAIVGLGIPRSAKLLEIEALYRGLAACGKKYHCPILGGDTNRSAYSWTIAVTVLGTSTKSPVLRRCAAAGDTLWVSGELGGAALAWAYWEKNRRLPSHSGLQRRLQRPVPRLQLGTELAKQGVTAMIDLSDGLAGDLQHLAEASRVGFEVELDCLPRGKQFSEKCRQIHAREEDLLLGGGEDYELLFTVSEKRSAAFARWSKGRGLTCIGKATAARDIRWMKAGRRISLKIRGFTHW